MVRVVIDTNVFVSALISKTHSPPLHVYNVLKSKDFLLITSPALLEELSDVLHREEIIKLHKLSPEQIQAILVEIAETSYIVSGRTLLQVVIEDPDDDTFLAAAIEGHAEYIVTGDHHLLDLRTYKDIKIVTPKEFLTIWRT